MDEQKLRQLFKNRSNCYADADEVIQAMDEDCFIETVNEALLQPPVIGLVCDKEKCKYWNSLFDRCKFIGKDCCKQTDL